jgi:hypothetical protein
MIPAGALKALDSTPDATGADTGVAAEVGVAAGGSSGG